MNISRKTKTIIICIVYAIVIVIQFAVFTPYTRTETYISSQNVPHTVIIKRGYASFEEADGYAFTDKKGVTARKQINYSLFAFQLILTTVLAVLVYYLWELRKQKNIDVQYKEKYLTLTKNYNELLENSKVVLKHLKQLQSENEALQSEISTLMKQQAAERPSENEQLSFLDILQTEPPYLDINGLAFADEETIRQAQKQYVEDLYKYFKVRYEK